MPAGIGSIIVAALVAISFLVTIAIIVGAWRRVPSSARVPMPGVGVSSAWLRAPRWLAFSSLIGFAIVASSAGFQLAHSGGGGGGGASEAAFVISLAQPIYLLAITQKMLEIMREEGWRIR